MQNVHLSKADDDLGPGLGFEKGAAADGAAADTADGNVVDGATSFSQTAWWPNNALHSSASQLRSTH